MTEDKGFPADIEDLLAQIRSEVSARHPGLVVPEQMSTNPKNAAQDNPRPNTAVAELEPAPEPQPFECKEGGYRIHDFLKFHDQDFVLNAYRGILQREADPTGLHAHLEELRQGRVSKVELLGRLRYSTEGRMKATKVRGLCFSFVAQTIFRIPVLGYMGRWLNALVMLPVIVRNFQKLDFYSRTQFDRLNQLMTTKSDRVEVRQLRESKADQADVAAILLQLTQIANDVHGQKRVLVEQERIFKALFEQACKPTVGSAAPERPKAISDEEIHLLDGFYVTFEDVFRGSREEVKEKLGVYLPYFSPAGLDAATPAVLDLGCGRGEWLEMLREQGLKGQGVDINRVALAMCRELGLEVTEGDAIAFLKEQKTGSFEAVTGFHLIEHFEFRTWINLFDETLRVLKPGGMLILETPNPLSFPVALGGFYRDPTHRLPVHPDTLKFIAESRGFVNVDTHFMDRALGGGKLLNARDVRFDDLAAYLKVSEDFVLMGYKP